MNLQNLTLENWLQNPSEDTLKKGGDTFPFFSKYDTFRDYLKNNVHQEVTKQAIYAEYLQGKDKDTIIFLNDHGPEHVKTVIKKAGELISNATKSSNGCDLNAREVYLLLNAIQIHDVGNFYGRVGHERKMMDVIASGLTPIMFDVPEAIYVKQIAQVHGGVIKYKDGITDKDTISSLKDFVVSDEYKIRQKLLASVLRFADELADNKHRADVKSLEAGRIPRGSEIFHAYAACLDSVMIVHETQTVELHFKVPKDYLIRTFGKIQKDEKTITDEYLIDEIYKRALKVHTERIYCSKFWKKHIDIDKIWVRIEFFARPKNPGSWEEVDLIVHPDITFSLDDFGYPQITDDIFQVCRKELEYSDGSKMTGLNVKLKVLKNEQSI